MEMNEMKQRIERLERIVSILSEGGGIMQLWDGYQADKRKRLAEAGAFTKPKNTYLEMLHNTFYGPHDEVIENPPFPEPKHDGIVKSHVCQSFKFTPGVTHIYELRKISDNDAFTNFKITPSSAVTEIKLYMGICNHIIEQPILYRLLNKDIEFYLMSDGRAMRPANSAYNPMIVSFKASADVEISYDIVSQLQKVEDKTHALIYSEQSTTEDIVMKPGGTFNVCMDYENPVVKLYAFLPEATVEARIIINMKDDNLIMTKEDNYYIFNFGDETSLNFSRIDTIYIKVKLSNNLMQNSTSDMKFQCRTVVISKNILVNNGRDMIEQNMLYYKTEF